MIKVLCAGIFPIMMFLSATVSLRASPCTQEEVRIQLNAYVKAYYNSQKIVDAFAGQFGNRTEVFDFHPNLPNGCHVIGMYGNNVCFGRGVVHTIMMRVQYLGFRFLLQYMSLPNGDMNNLVIPLSSPCTGTHEED